MSAGLLDQALRDDLAAIDAFEVDDGLSEDALAGINFCPEVYDGICRRRGNSQFDHGSTFLFWIEGEIELFESKSGYFCTV